jgi:signal peptidase I
MEERLFWIGVAMGAYAYGTRYGTANGILDTRLRTTLWHALFCAIAGFAATMIAVMSLESRGRFAGGLGVLSLREFYPASLGALVLGLWGAISAYRKGDTREGRQYYQTEDMEWAETVFSAVILASLLMYFVVQAFKIPSGSMRTTLLEGDHLFVNKFIYGVRIPFTKKRIARFKPLERGDIVVFQFPTTDPDETHCGSPQYGKDFIKRVVALPGDKVELRGLQLLINDKVFENEPYAQYIDPGRQPRMPSRVTPEEYQLLWQSHQLDKHLGDAVRDFFGPVTVPQGTYMMMGDNRDRSCDSRFWGPVEDHFIKGKAWVIYWPPSRIGRVK